MSLLSTKGQSAAINGVLAVTSHVGCNTASPGTTGANEYAGVTRNACSWNTSTGGSNGTNSSALSFTTDNLTAVTHMQGWDALSTGNPTLGFTLGASVKATTITAAPGALAASAS